MRIRTLALGAVITAMLAPSAFAGSYSVRITQTPDCKFIAKLVHSDSYKYNVWVGKFSTKHAAKKAAHHAKKRLH